ncbi:MFS transporter [Streptomyces sp. NPDC101151]|uniref:MFS transporter n=1 Tax=Streptomyces sp. NPDC101151 TaxID=3366115 RepID=UPI0037F68E65
MSTVLDLPADSSYRRLLTSAHVLRLLAGATLGHLPVAMAPLALLIAVRAGGGSVSQAGLLAAAYGVSAAVGQPWWGGVLDRRGQTVPLVVTGLGSTAAFLALAAVPIARYPAAAMILTVAAGLTTPPLEAALRVLWPEVTGSPAQLRAALSLDASAQEVVFIVGPLLVLAIGTAAGPPAILAAVALLAVAGTVAFATARPARRWQPAPSIRTGVLAPLRCCGPRTLAAALLFAGAALGALNVVALAFAEHHSVPALTTLMPTALAAGSLIGGLLYGRLRWPGAPPAHLRATALGLLIGFLPLLLRPGPAAAIAVVVLPGLFLAPLLISVFSSLDDLAPRGTLGTAAAWMIACLGLGQAAGTALASLTAGPPAPLATALTGAAAAWMTLFLRRTSLTPLQPRHPPGAREAAPQTTAPDATAAGPHHRQE